MKKLIPGSLALVLFASSNLIAQPENPQKGSFQLVTEAGITQLQEAYIEQSRAHSGIQGYRVQIYNGKKNETSAKRAAFVSVFPSVPVYTLYEAPEYKLQAGNFRTRLEAEKFLKEVVAQFGSGFVVSTEIKPPELPKLSAQ